MSYVYKGRENIFAQNNIKIGKNKICEVKITMRECTRSVMGHINSMHERIDPG